MFNERQLKLHQHLQSHPSATLKIVFYTLIHQSGYASRLLADFHVLRKGFQPAPSPASVQK